MRFFILISSKFHIPKPLLHQKVLDIIELGLSVPDFQFYIVGDTPVDAFLDLEQNNDRVTIIDEQETKKIMGTLHQCIVLHFGGALKITHRFTSYFIPLTHPSNHKNLSFFKKWALEKSFKNFIQKAAATYVTNDGSFYFLKNKYKNFTSRIKEAYLPITTLPSFEWVALAEAKNKLTEGANYFLAFQPLEAFVDMLKEFSVFKKWQQTNMSLVFIFENELEIKQAKKLLAGYTFKDSIITQSIDAFDISWLAAAYAVTLHTFHFNKTILMEMAIRFQIPLLINHNKNAPSFFPSSWTDAGEIFSFDEKGALSNHFKLYYKDEQYRQSRINLSKEWLTNYYAKREKSGMACLPLSFNNH